MLEYYLEDSRFLDNGQGYCMSDWTTEDNSSSSERLPNDSLKLSLELAGREQSWKDYAEHKDNQTLASIDSLSPKFSNRELEMNRSGSPNNSACDSRRDTALNGKGSRFSETFIEPVEEQGGERVRWEYHNVALTRVPGYGFGIAVSGGRDNPHFVNGEPSIAISDVLKAGPAEGKLQINDRVISANGLSLENVDYATAVQVLRECGNTVNLVIKRRVVLPPAGSESQTIKVTLTKNKKKDDYGIILGCKIYVREVSNKSLADKDGGVQEGDIIMKINSSSTDSMTLKEAKKLIENSKERLQLVIKRDSNRLISNENQRWSTSNQYDLSNHNKEPNSNFIDVTGSRPHWTNQNLYVQPPTRGDSRPPLPPERADEKNNLSRVQGGGRNRGPIMDISLGQLDQPATPLLPGHQRLEDDAPPRPPPPRVNEYGTRREKFDDDPLARRGKTAFQDPRHISFQKDGSVGIRLTGGNKVGIFVTAVQPGSPASLQGLQPGDKILKVNNIDMRGVTREEAVLLLLSIQDQVHLIVQHCRDEYDEIVSNQKGDSFYIRTHFNYETNGKGELTFHVGEVFHVIDTLYNGVVGSWLVYRLGRNNQEIQKGVIPNKNRAEELAQEQHNQAKKDASTESRGSFFKRRSARRSKSLSKDHWEDVVFADGLSKFPAYERVTLKHPGFIRPVVLFGPVGDIARDKLLKDYPDKYASPQLDSHLDELPKSQKSSGIIRLSAIKEIIEKGKHAILDITPNAVDRLNYAQFYPIVIFMRAENKHTVKELRSRLAKSSNKSSKKLYDHAVKLEKLWCHIFTANITLTSADMWYKKLRETIEKQQQVALWVSESKPEEVISDDFLFPMTSRLSYASSPESDLDLTSDTRPLSLQDSSGLISDRRLVKASSDPSIATQEDTGGFSGYGHPPPYSSRSRQDQTSPGNGQDFSGNKHNALSPDQRYQSPYMADDHGRDQYYSSGIPSNNDPYTSLSSNDRFGGRVNGEGQEIYGMKTRSPPEPEPPPRVDRGSKPVRCNGSAQERLFGTAGRCDGREQPGGLSPDYINTTANKSGSLDRPNGRVPGYDSSSYSSDSYNKYAGQPVSPDRPRDRFSSTSSSQTQRTAHDPYRFTRSTAQPLKPGPPERGRMPPQSPPKPGERPPPMTSPPAKPPGYQPRLSDGRPVPPPKPAHYRPRPWSQEDGMPPGAPPGPRPPEVAPPPYSRDRSSRDGTDYSSMQSGYYSNRSNYGEPTSPPRPPPPPMPDDHAYRNHTVGRRGGYHDDDTSGGFDSGHSSTLDRNYDSRVYGKTGLPPPPPGMVNGGGPYLNLPYSPQRGRGDHGYPNSPPPPPPPPSSLLDLSNRENRGSAFELYKKPDSRSLGMHHPPHLMLNAEHANGEEDDEDDGEKSLSRSEDNLNNVVATASGVFDAEGGTLVSNETGVSIVIPPGALSEGTKQEIFFKVCQDSSMLPPLDREKGETLLSPLVMCGPHGLKFQVPVELRLPHCAALNPESWSFALKSSDTPNGQPAEWQNVSLDNMDGVMSSHIKEKYVSVLVDHF